MKTSKKLKVLTLGLMTTLLVALTSLSGCSKEIGDLEDSDPELKGQRTTETLAQSGASVTRVYLNADKLEEGTSYKFNNVSLTIQGNIPPDTTIKGYNGQLTIIGNLGKDVEINLSVPEYTHQESYSCMQYNAALKMSMPSTCWKTISDGPKPPFDQDPVLVLKGHADETSSFKGTYGTFSKVGL